VLYGRTPRLEITTAPGEGFVATITLPLRTGSSRAPIAHGAPRASDRIPRLASRAP
jgi:hypothetical protein